jgi:hypothetical protein
VSTRRAVTITHTAKHGTVLAGTRYGDGSWSMLRSTWEWRPARRSWLLIGSPAADPDLLIIAKTVRALEAIGFVVALDIDLPDTRATNTPAARPTRRSTTCR